MTHQNAGHAEPPSDAGLRVGDWILDDCSNTLSSGGNAVALSPLGARLLRRLAASDGCVPRSELIAELWKGNHLVGEPALTRVVSELRKALGDSSRQPHMIQTVPRVGYRLVRLGAAAQRNEPRRLTAQERPLKWALIGAGVLLVAVALQWLIENAIGLAWALRE